MPSSRSPSSRARFPIRAPQRDISSRGHSHSLGNASRNLLNSRIRHVDLAGRLKRRHYGMTLAHALARIESRRGTRKFFMRSKVDLHVITTTNCSKFYVRGFSAQTPQGVVFPGRCALFSSRVVASTPAEAAVKARSATKEKGCCVARAPMFTSRHCGALSCAVRQRACRASTHR
jgi:hypothetical protein